MNELNILYLYPDILELYGDFGNIQVLKYRLEKRGIKANVTPYSIGNDAPNFSDYDLVFAGGGADQELGHGKGMGGQHPHRGPGRGAGGPDGAGIHRGGHGAQLRVCLHGAGAHHRGLRHLGADGLHRAGGSGGPWDRAVVGL